VLWRELRFLLPTVGCHRGRSVRVSGCRRRPYLSALRLGVHTPGKSDVEHRDANLLAAITRLNKSSHSRSNLDFDGNMWTNPLPQLIDGTSIKGTATRLLWRMLKNPTSPLRGHNRCSQAQITTFHVSLSKVIEILRQVVGLDDSPPEGSMCPDGGSAIVGAFAGVGGCHGGKSANDR
jgi:hypothetical protein